MKIGIVVNGMDSGDIRDFHFTQVSTKQNEIMKVLTIVSSVVIPLRFVAGL